MSPKPIVIKTQLKHQLFTHTFNNWYASCTRNFKNPLASTYSSLISGNWFFLTRVLDELVHSLKFLIKKNLITKRLPFHNTHCPWPNTKLKEHPSFGQYVFKQYKSIDKGNKRSSKEAKKPYYNYHLHRLRVTINDMNSFQTIAFILDRSSTCHNTGFVQCSQQFYQVARRIPNSLTISRRQHSDTKIQSTMTKTKTKHTFGSFQKILSEESNKMGQKISKTVSWDFVQHLLCPNCHRQTVKRKHICSSIFPTWTTNKKNV